MIHFGGRPVVGFAIGDPGLADSAPAPDPAPPPPEHTDWGLFFGTLAAFAGTVGLFGWGLHAAGAANR